MKAIFLYFLSFLAPFILSAQDASNALKFVANKGQWNDKVKYKADIPDGKLFAEKNSFTYTFYDAGILGEMHHHGEDATSDEINMARGSQVRDITKIHKTKLPVLINAHAFRVIPEGAEETVSILPSKKAPEVYNYYLGNDPSRWASGVNAYNELLYQGIYPKTDMRLYLSDNKFKYEFLVYPGADPTKIKLRYEGLKDIRIVKGDLVLQTSVNVITEMAPYVYQLIQGKEVKIRSQFGLRDSTVFFEILQKYDKDYPLIIDPQLIFSTYSGSFADNWGNTATNDAAGNMYSGGTVFNVGYPTTVGAYQINFGGLPINQAPDFIPEGEGVDVGILKFNTTGTALLYATYLGGHHTEAPYSLVVNNNDELIIMGATGSLNFPVTAGAFDNTFNGGTSIEPVNSIIFLNGTDIFISRLSSDGSALLASTYVGGSANDGIQPTSDNLVWNYGDEMRGDVITDDQNNIYISSNTRSLNFPVTAGAYQTSNAGNKDACVFKLNSAMTNLMWSTYLGGNQEDIAYSIQVDTLYNVYVSGSTTSLNFPTTAGVHQTTHQGFVDGYITHINNNGQSLLHSTFVGTNNFDQSYFVQLDSSQNVYVLGQTFAAYPVTSGTYSNAGAGHFIHAFTPELDSTLFSTVVGKSGFRPVISPTAFLVNECGNIFLSGWGGNVNSAGGGYIGGNTNGLPVTSDAYRNTSDGSDFYIMVLSAGATSLLYSTYFGLNNSAWGPNDHVDGGTSRFDKKGIIYEAVCGGCNNNDNFPTTPGAWSRTNNSSNCNNAAFKFDLANLEALFTVDRQDSCGRATVLINNLSAGGKTFFWDFDDGQTSTQQSPTNHVYTTPGNYLITLIITDLTTCIAKDTSVVPLFLPPVPPVVFNVANTAICEGFTTQFGATFNPTYTYLWTPATGLDNPAIANPVASPAQTTTYHVVVEDTNQCKVEKDITVTVNPTPSLEAGPNQLVCPGSSVVLNVSGTGTFVWDASPYLSCTLCKNPTVKPPDVSDEMYRVEITDANGCKNRDSVAVRTRPFPDIHVSFVAAGRCVGEEFGFIPEVRYSDLTCPVFGEYTWDFGDGFISHEEKPKHQYTSDGSFQVTVKYAYSNLGRDTILVLTKDSCLKNVFIPNTFTPNGDGNNDKVFLRTINATKILLRIFNRWGEEVFRTESLHEGWDGTYKGVKQTPQTFVYVAEVTFYDDTRKVLEGNITLVE